MYTSLAHNNNNTSTFIMNNNNNNTNSNDKLTLPQIQHSIPNNNFKIPTIPTNELSYSSSYSQTTAANVNKVNDANANLNANPNTNNQIAPPFLKSNNFKKDFILPPIQSYFPSNMNHSSSSSSSSSSNNVNNTNGITNTETITTPMNNNNNSNNNININTGNSPPSENSYTYNSKIHNNNLLPYHLQQQQQQQTSNNQNSLPPLFKLVLDSTLPITQPSNFQFSNRNNNNNNDSLIYSTTANNTSQSSPLSAASPTNTSTSTTPSANISTPSTPLNNLQQQQQNTITSPKYYSSLDINNTNTNTNYKITKPGLNSNSRFSPIPLSISSSNSSIGSNSISSTNSIISSLPPTTTTTNKRKKRECPICHNFYSNLTTHKSIHNDNLKPFQCKECSRSFKRLNDLIRHEKCHLSQLGEWEFQCPFFKPVSDLNNKPIFNSEINKNNKSDEINNDNNKKLDLSNPDLFKPTQSCHNTGCFSRCDTYKNHLKAIHFMYPPNTTKQDRNKVSGNCRECGLIFKNVNDWLLNHIENSSCSKVVNKVTHNHHRKSITILSNSHSSSPKDNLN